MRKQQPNLRRRTFFTPLLMPILGSIAALAFVAWVYSSISTTTVVLVRHAEKVIQAGDDPGLTPEGVLRAKALATMFSTAGVDALFASQFRRTKETLSPLSAATGKDIEQVDARDPVLLVDKIFSLHRGQLVIVAGHSNTIPELIQLLANIDTPAIDESDYGSIYILTLPRFGEARLLQIGYPELASPRADLP